MRSAQSALRNFYCTRLGIIAYNQHKENRMKKLIALALGVVIAAGAAAQEKKRTSGMTVTIGGTDFAATLDGNDAARNIAALLPLTLSMSEWAGNSEYYARLPQKTDTGNAVSPRSVRGGRHRALQRSLARHLLCGDHADLRLRENRAH